MKIAIVIPARMGSSRFPGKPLTPILNLPMIEHVRRRVALLTEASEVIVATCDNEILEAVQALGGKAVMTLPTHERCTERVEEAARNIDADIIVNVQGDEPLIDPDSILAVCSPLIQDSKVNVANIVHEIKDLSEVQSKHVVKVVLSQDSNILYFSRSGIPGLMTDSKVTFYKQAGIMAFRREFLNHFVNEMTPGPLEKAESVDMLRILENGFQIKAVVWDEESVGVDLPEHIEKVEKLILENVKHKEIFNKITK